MKNVINTINIINVSTKLIIFFFCEIRTKEQQIKTNIHQKCHPFSPYLQKLQKIFSPLSTKALTIYSHFLLHIAKDNHQGLEDGRGGKALLYTKKIHSQSSNLSNKLIQKLSMCCLSRHKCLHHSTKRERKRNSRLSNFQEFIQLWPRDGVSPTS